MQLTSINPTILQTVLDSAPNALDKGQAQFYTPLSFGFSVAAVLPRHRPVIVDLNAGAGHLLQASEKPETAKALALDIDPAPAPITKAEHDALRAISPNFLPIRLNRITGDLTAVYPLLVEVGFRADLFALNPPFGLQWPLDRLAALAESRVPAVRECYAAALKSQVSGQWSVVSGLDSTIATLLIALDRMTQVGELFCVANHRTIQRLIFAPGAPFAALAQHIWARLVIAGNPMTGRNDCAWQKDQLYYTEVIYMARSHTFGPRTYYIADAVPDTLSDLPNLMAVPDLAGWAGAASTLRNMRRGVEITRYNPHEHTFPAWEAVRDRVAELAGARPAVPWNLWLENGLIRTDLSRFDAASDKTDKILAGRLHQLDSKSPMQLVLQRAQRDELLHHAQAAGWRVHPELLAAVLDAVRDYHASRAPLYPLSKYQCLGYLDEQDKITCAADLHLDGAIIFRAGETYPIVTKTIQVIRKAVRPNPVTGEEEPCEYTGHEPDIRITSGTLEYSFLDAKLRDPSITLPIKMHFTLQQLADSFHIPTPPDVAAADPVRYEGFLAALTALESLFTPANN